MPAQAGRRAAAVAKQQSFVPLLECIYKDFADLRHSQHDFRTSEQGLFRGDRRFRIIRGEEAGV